MKRFARFAALGLMVLAFSSIYAFAGVASYTTLSSFQTATSGLMTENFDAASAPAVLLTGGATGTYGALTFHANIDAGDGSLEIVNYFPTTSGSNYLGSDDSSGAFFASDSVSITFAHMITAAGLYIVTGSPVTASTFTLNAGVGTTLNSSTADVTLPAGGGYGYYLGLTSTTQFQTITISLTTPGGTADGPLWNIDDVSWGKNSAITPEPGTLLLIGTGLFAAFRRLKRPL